MVNLSVSQESRDRLIRCAKTYDNAAKQIAEISRKFKHEPNFTEEVESALDDLKDRYRKIAQELRIIATAVITDELKKSASNIKDATDKYKEAIQKLETINNVTKKVAQIIGLVGNLSSAVASRNLDQIGQALESLLKTGSGSS